MDGTFTSDALDRVSEPRFSMCQAYRQQYGFNAISLMPTNLYGSGDNFNLESAHVLPALIRRFHEAKTRREGHVTVWGTGTPKREFLHADDFADAALFLMDRYDEADLINVGCGEDLSIGELAQLVKEVVAFSGEIQFDTTKPDETPRKLLDVSKLNALGWRPRISLEVGIVHSYRWFLENQELYRG